jgi:hypothetical protein
MSRFGSGTSQQNLLTAFTSTSVKPVFLIEIHWGGTSYDRLTTAGSTLTYDGNNYIDAGDMISISNADENSDLGASGISIALTASNATTLSRARTSNFQGKETKVYLGALDSSNNLIDAIPYFIGYNDTVTIDQAVNRSVITLKVENKLIRLGKKNIRRYTEEDQKRFSNYGYTPFEFVTYIADKPIKW